VNAIPGHSFVHDNRCPSMSPPCNTTQTPAANLPYALSIISSLRLSCFAKVSVDSAGLESHQNFDLLENTPALRNILMALPPDTMPAAQIESVTTFYLSSDEQKHISTTGISNRLHNKRQKRHKIKEILQSIFSVDPAISTFYKKTFPTIHNYKLFNKVTFLSGILDNEFSDQVQSKLTMQTVFMRLQKTENAMIDNVNIRINHGGVVGGLWKKGTRLEALK
jgi:hypothetical protein